MSTTDRGDPMTEPTSTPDGGLREAVAASEAEGRWMTADEGRALIDCGRWIARDSVNAVAKVLMAAWWAAEGKEVSAAYVATFADMARALLAANAEPVPTEAAHLSTEESEPVPTPDSEGWDYDSLADWMGDMDESRNVEQGMSGEYTTVITIDVEELARRMVARLAPDSAADDTTAGEREPEHFPWHHTEFGVVCACGRSMNAAEECPADTNAYVVEVKPSTGEAVFTPVHLEPVAGPARDGVDFPVLPPLDVPAAPDADATPPPAAGEVEALADLLDERDRMLATIARVEALLPSCYVTRHPEWRCTAMIGAGFPNQAKWTEEMCCLPCRLRAALAGEDA